MRSTLYSERGTAETHEDQGGVGVLVALLHVFGIVLHRLSFVHGVEIELRVVVLDAWCMMGWRYIRRASLILSRVSSFVLAANSISQKRTTGGQR